MCISYGVLVCCISLKCAFFAMVFFFVESVIVLLLCAAIHYSYNALTSLIFKILKLFFLLLWVLCCFIYLFIYKFYFVDMSWCFFYKFVAFLFIYNLVFSFNLCEDGQHVFIESSIFVPLNGFLFFLVPSFVVQCFIIMNQIL
jgi:hypothetical protein